MNRAVIVILVWMLPGLCFATHPASGAQSSDMEHARLGSAPTAADSAYLREMAAFMEIVDPDYWLNHLRHTPDLTAFRADLDGYSKRKDFASRPDTPHRNEWREDMERRLDWCRRNLSTPIYASVPDVRWELVVRHGVPAAAWRSTVRCPIGTRGPFIFVVYNMVWPVLGLAVSCELSDFGNFSTGYGPLTDWGTVTDDQEDIEITPAMHAGMTSQKMLTQAELSEPARFIAFPGLKKIINASVSTYVFPNSDGTSDLCVAALIRGDQFTDSTLRGDRLELEFSVYDTALSLAAKDSRLIGGLRELATGGNARQLAIPAYLTCAGLSPGLYEFALSIQGESAANLGVYRDTITIPTRRALRGASDVMIAFAPGVANGRGIVRHGMQLHANPSGTHAKSDSLAVYVEFPESAIHGDEYRVTVSLIPQKNAIVNWRTSTGREQTLYSSVLPRVVLDGKFRGNVSLADVKSGRYFLSVQIASQLKDPIGEEPVMAWTEIEVK